MANELEIMKKYYKDPDLAAREWKARGGKVVGYFCNTVPEELIWAAGMLPVRIAGVPGGDVTELTKWFNVNRYTEGFVNTALNRILVGECEYLDYIVFPHQTRNTLQTQYSHMYMMRELAPEGTVVPELYFIEAPQSWAHTSVEYLMGSFLEFKGVLEQWAEGEISQNRLLEAIQMCNRSRELLHRLAKLRNEQKVSGCEAMEIYGASFRMDKDEFNRVLELALVQMEERDPLPGKRIFLEGSPQDNLQFYKLAESCGAIIVNEDNCWGSRSFEDLVDVQRFPCLIEALAQRYHYKAPCGYVYFPASARCNYCGKKVEQIPIDGVVFYVLENDAHGLWDYADQVELYQAAGHPVLELLHQPYEIKDEEELRQKLTEFFARL